MMMMMMLMRRRPGNLVWKDRYKDGDYARTHFFFKNRSKQRVLSQWFTRIPRLYLSIQTRTEISQLCTSYYITLSTHSIRMFHNISTWLLLLSAVTPSHYYPSTPFPLFSFPILPSPFQKSKSIAATSLTLTSLNSRSSIPLLLPPESDYKTLRPHSPPSSLAPRWRLRSWFRLRAAILRSRGLQE